MVSKFSMGWTFELLLPIGDELRDQFSAFVQGIGASALEWGGMGTGHGTPADLGNYRGNRTLRVTAFSDTLVFDPAGAVTVDPTGAKACTCILELQGCWTSPTRWGVRWRVVQVKLSDEAPPVAVVVAAPPALASYAFQDDDEPALKKHKQ